MGDNQIFYIEDPEEYQPQKMYSNIIFGGTFDHVHDGHRQIFRLANKMVKDHGKITVGLANGPLLAHKIEKQFINSYEERFKNLCEELKEKNPCNKKYELDIVEITTREGPTHDGKYVDGCLIVSEETLAPGKQINQYRRAHGLEPFVLAVVMLKRDEFGNVLSSTSIRQEYSSSM